MAKLFNRDLKVWFSRGALLKTLSDSTHFRYPQNAKIWSNSRKSLLQIYEISQRPVVLEALAVQAELVAAAYPHYSTVVLLAG